MSHFSMKKACTGLLGLVLMGALPSCGMLRKWFGGSDSGSGRGGEGAGTAVVERPANQLVGEVASVHREEGFVLIRRYGGGKLPEGVVFNTSGPGGRTASIRPTGERSGRFYAADLTSGEPQKGDAVLARRLPSGSVEESTPIPERKEPGFSVP